MEEIGGVTNQYEYDDLDSFFRGGNAPAGFEVGLCSSLPKTTDTPMDIIGEPSGNGYSRQPLARNTTDFPTLELEDGHYKVSSKKVLFTAAGGSLPTVNYWFLVITDSPPRFESWGPTSGPITLLDGQSYGQVVSMKKQG